MKQVTIVGTIEEIIQICFHFRLISKVRIRSKIDRNEIPKQNCWKNIKMLDF